MPARLAITAVFLPLVGGIAGCTSSTTPALDAETTRVAADGEPGNWLAHGRTYGEQRYSLARITSGNVGRLGLAWSYDLGMNHGAEATPIVRDGVM